MAITVDWPTGVINVPRNDMLLLQSTPTEIRQLNTEDLRKALRALESSEEGRPFPATVRYVGPTTVGGVTLASQIKITDYYTVTFENGSYAVNLVGSNNNIADRTNVNNVSVRSSNSAGLQDLSTLLASAYMGEVCVDVVNGQAGTSIPVGTRSTPLNNFADAVTVASNLGIGTIRLLSDATIATTNFSKGYKFTSDNRAAITATLDTTANLANCQFENLTITGVMDSNSILSQCDILNLTYFTGFIWQCSLNGIVTVEPGAKASIADSFSNVPGGADGDMPVLDLSNTGDLALRGWSGGLKIRNVSSNLCDVSLDFLSGRLLVESTCTLGNIYVRGDCRIEDSSLGATVIDRTESVKLEEAHSALLGNSTYNPTTKIISLKSADNPATTIAEYDVVVTDNNITSKTRRP